MSRAAYSVSQATPPATRPVETPTAKHAEFCCQFDLSKPNSVFLVEDKSPAESWEWQRDTYLWALLEETNKAKWECIPGVTPEDADLALKNFIADSLPERFRFMSKQVRAWPKNIVPYLYGSVKLKCWFPDGGGRRCEKPAHSCYRRIISYFRLWRRKYWRRIHRGNQIMLEGAPTRSCWNLDDTPRALHDSFNE